MRHTTSSPLLQALISLEDTLRRYRVPVIEHLQPGLPAEQIEATLESIDVSPHPDLITFWTWHNGVNADPSGWRAEFSIMSCYWPLDLPSALCLREEQVEEDDPPVTAPLYTFPVIGFSNAADLYLDTVNGTVGLNDPHAPPEDFGPFHQTWASLTDWIDDAITLYNTGHVYIDPLSETPTLDRKHWPPGLPTSSHW